MQLVTPDAYYTELLAAIPNATKRIVLAAMVVLADRKTAPVLEAILAARKRGVAVTILYDVYTYTWFSTNSTASHKRMRLIARSHASIDRLAVAGAVILPYGKIGLNPFKGRCHMKVTIVDDTVYTFGGVNFAGQHFKHTDYMFRSNDAALADKLENIVREAPKTRRNSEWHIDPHNTLLFDGGIPRRSVIYDQVCELTARAERVYYVSQMAPSGKLVRLLKQTESHCYFNRPSADNVVLAASLIIDQLRSHMRNTYTRRTFIHAKFILFELEDGSKALVSGSNNFSWRGVAYGTQELAVYSTDAHVWQQLRDFMLQSIE